MPPKRYRGTYFTLKQIRVLKLKEEGKSVDEIAKMLGVTKADVHIVLRNAMKIVTRARETLKLYIEITGILTLTFEKGTPISDLISKTCSEADLAGVKLNLKTYDLILEVMKIDPSIVDPWRQVITKPLKIIINRDGRMKARLLEESST